MLRNSVHLARFLRLNRIFQQPASNADLQTGFVELKRSEGSWLVGGTSLEDRILRNHDDPLQKTGGLMSIVYSAAKQQQIQQ